MSVVVPSYSFPLPVHCCLSSLLPSLLFPIYRCASFCVVWWSARLFELIPLVWRIDASCNRFSCVHRKMFWVQGFGRRNRCLSVQLSTQLLHVLCLRTYVRFRGFVHYSGALRPAPNPVIRLPCWHILIRFLRGQSICWCPDSLQR